MTISPWIQIGRATPQQKKAKFSSWKEKNLSHLTEVHTAPAIWQSRWQIRADNHVGRLDEIKLPLPVQSKKGKASWNFCKLSFPYHQWGTMKLLVHPFILVKKKEKLIIIWTWEVYSDCGELISTHLTGNAEKYLMMHNVHTASIQYTIRKTCVCTKVVYAAMLAPKNAG